MLTSEIVATSAFPTVVDSSLVRGAVVESKVWEAPLAVVNACSVAVPTEVAEAEIKIPHNNEQTASRKDCLVEIKCKMYSLTYIGAYSATNSPRY